jgi:putative spermidine/putrescine transport system permease protein
LSRAAWRRRALSGFCAVVAVWLVAPAFVVIPLSFTDKASFQFPPTGWSLRWYEAFFENPEWIDSVVTSAKLAVVVTVLATILGTAMALVLTRERVVAKGVLWAIVLSPLVVPTVVAAVGIYAVYIKWHLTGRFWGLVAAHTCLAIPLVTVAVSASLSSLDKRLGDAAASLGATPWRTFKQVTLPIVAPGVLTGAVFAFVTSFDEIVIALLLQSADSRTLPVKMFSSLTVNIDPTVAVASTFTMIMTISVLLLLGRMRREGRR